MIILEKEQRYDDLIDNILYTSGVDVDYHLKPTIDAIEPLSGVDTELMNKGAELLNKHIYEHNTIGIIVD